MAIATIVIKSNRSAAQLRQDLFRENDNPRTALTLLANYIQGLAGGAKSGRVMVAIDDGTGDAAEAEIGCVHAEVSAGDTVTIGGVVFTVRAAPSSSPADGEFAAGSGNNALAANLGAAINAHPRLKGLLHADVTAADVAIVCEFEGPAGSVIEVETDNSDAFVIADSAETLEDGTIGESVAPPRAYLAGA